MSSTFRSLVESVCEVSSVYCVCGASPALQSATRIFPSLRWAHAVLTLSPRVSLAVGVGRASLELAQAVPAQSVATSTLFMYDLASRGEILPQAECTRSVADPLEAIGVRVHNAERVAGGVKGDVATD